VRHIFENDPEAGFDKFGRTRQEFAYLKSDPARFPSRNWIPLENITSTGTGNTQPSGSEHAFMRTTKSSWLHIFQAAALFLAGCSDWQYDVTVQGVAFSKVKTEDNGLVIGQLKEDTLIGGRPCKRGWVHLRPNGVPVGFAASREIDLGRFTIPADTWVFQNEDGVVTVCAFPRDTEVQGHLCRGSGGPEGVQAAFYPSGSLKEYFLRHATRIQGIPCKGGLVTESIKLHENGRLKACVLSEELVRGGHTYPVNTHLRFDSDGHIIP
jgi:hypothetical protein